MYKKINLILALLFVCIFNPIISLAGNEEPSAVKVRILMLAAENQKIASKIEEIRQHRLDMLADKMNFALCFSLSAREVSVHLNMEGNYSKNINDLEGKIEKALGEYLKLAFEYNKLTFRWKEQAPPECYYYLMQEVAKRQWHNEIETLRDLEKDNRVLTRFLRSMQKKEREEEISL